MMPGATPGWTTPGDPAVNEKVTVIQAAIEQEELGDKAYDPEKDQGVPKRPFLLTHAMTVGLAMILVVVVEMACLAKLLQEVRLDGKMIRFALVATIPLFASFSLFFMIVITGSLFQLVGPLSSVCNNSLYYSAKAPKVGRYADLELPHVTIQMPVYKEGLKGVIMPTVESLLAAVKHYEEQGGTASIFVNDDGMQLVKPELQEYTTLSTLIFGTALTLLSERVKRTTNSITLAIARVLLTALRRGTSTSSGRVNSKRRQT
jgi:hypothetical protein